MTVSIWIYTIAALGALGVYLLLPKPGRSTRIAGTLLGMISLAGLLGFSVTELGSSGFSFYILSGLALVCSTLVITQKRPVYSALYFIVVVLSVAGLALRLDAEFLAVALVIIYAGAILVTYVFVIMLAQQSGQALYDARSRSPLAACFAGFMLVATIGSVTSEARLSPTAEQQAQASPQVEGNTEALGTILFSRYVLVLEVAGVLLVLAIVGAIAVARRRIPPQDRIGAHESLVLGEAGRKAVPF